MIDLEQYYLEENRKKEYVIQELKKNKKISGNLAKISRFTGISLSSLSRYLTKERDPSPRAYNILYEYLKPENKRYDGYTEIEVLNTTMSPNFVDIKKWIKKNKGHKMERAVREYLADV